MVAERTRCNALMHRCFPAHAGPSAARLHDLFVATVCDNLRCNADGSAEPFRLTKQHDNTVRDWPVWS
jgi:hypothetical protein